METKIKKTMYFDRKDLGELIQLLEKRETESEFIRTAIKNEINRRKENPSV